MALIRFRPGDEWTDDDLHDLWSLPAPGLQTVKPDEEPCPKQPRRSQHGAAPILAEIPPTLGYYLTY